MQNLEELYKLFSSKEKCQNFVESLQLSNIKLFNAVIIEADYFNKETEFKVVYQNYLIEFVFVLFFYFVIICS